LVPCTTRPGPVSMPWRVLCDRPSAGIVRPQVHPSVTALPFRVPSHLAPARCLSAPSTLLGFLALSRHHRIASTPARLPGPRYVPSSGFRSPSTACSALRLGGLFHPPAMSRAVPVQGFIPPRSHPPSSGGVAPLPLVPAALAGPGGPTATRRELGFEALLRAEMRATGAVIGRLGGRSPPQVSSPPGSPFPRREPRLPGAIRSWRCSAGTRLRGCPPGRLQRVVSAGPDHLFRDRRPARDFRPASRVHSGPAMFPSRTSLRRPFRSYSTDLRSPVSRGSLRKQTSECRG
jgi:hypothetical protein